VAPEQLEQLLPEDPETWAGLNIAVVANQMSEHVNCP